MSKKILICVGHGKSKNGGYDSGAINSRLNLQEHKICIGICKEVHTYLKDYECLCDVINLNSKMSLVDRINYANKGKYDVIVEVHLNAHTTQNANGTETYYYANDSVGKKLADNITNEIVSTLKTKKRCGNKGTTYFGIVRETKGTAVLVETCFISNDNEVKKVMTPAGQKQAGQAIAKGVVNAYNLKKKIVSNPVPTKASNNKKLYRVQCGAFTNKASANNLLFELEKAGFKGFVKEIGNLHKVQVGAFSNKQNAENYMKQIKAKGFQAFIV